MDGSASLILLGSVAGKLDSQSHAKRLRTQEKTKIYVVRPSCIRPQERKPRMFILSPLTLGKELQLHHIYRPALLNFQASP